VIELDIKIDIRRAQQFYTNLRRNAVKKAAARAINDTLITLRAEGAREIKREHPALSIGLIKNNMVMKRAYYLNLRGSVSTQGRPLSALMFSPSGGIRGKRTTSPVKARFGKNRTVLTYQGRKAFRVKAYANEVFVRTFAKGRRIRKLRGPSLPGVFRARSERFLQIARERWAQTFASRMRYEISQAGR
jgi:hypothetical protein